MYLYVNMYIHRIYIKEEVCTVLVFFFFTLLLITRLTIKRQIILSCFYLLVDICITCTFFSLRTLNIPQLMVVLQTIQGIYGGNTTNCQRICP